MTKPKVWLLLKIQLLGLFGINKLFHSGTPREKLRAAFVGIGMLLFCAMIALYSVGLAVMLCSAGLAEIVPALALMLCSLATLTFTFIKSNGILFGFQDFDTVFSLPVRASSVLWSRLLTVYLGDLGFACLVLLPSLTVYAVNTGLGPFWWMTAAISILFAPVPPMIAAMLLGALVTTVSSRFRRRNLVTVLLSVLGTVAILAFSMSGSRIRDMEQFTSIATLIADAVHAAWPPAALYTAAIVRGEVPAFLWFALLSALPAVLLVALLSRYYVKINSALFARGTRGNFRVKEMRATAPFRALLVRESRRLGSSPVYIMNTCVGAMMMLAAAVALAVMGPRAFGKVFELPDILSQGRRMAPVVLSLFVVMSCTTCVSLNIEGKSRGVLYALPVEPFRLFLAKIALNLLIVLPCVAVSAVLCAVTLGCGLPETVFLFLLPAAYALFTATAGIFLNLKFPRYDWTSEHQAVKKSISLMASILIGFLTIAAPALLCVVLGFEHAFLLFAATIAALLAATAFLLARLRRVRLYLS